MLYRDKSGGAMEAVIIRIMRYFPLKGGTSCYCETIQNETFGLHLQHIFRCFGLG